MLIRNCHLLQSYIVGWCNLNNSRYSYCYHYNRTNVTESVTDYKLSVLAGDTYSIYVYAVTTNGQGRYKYMQKTVPPLNLKVSSVYFYKTGRYGLQVYLYWYGPYVSEPLVSTYFSRLSLFVSCV